MEEEKKKRGKCLILTLHLRRALEPETASRLITKIGQILRKMLSYFSLAFNRLLDSIFLWSLLIYLHLLHNCHISATRYPYLLQSSSNNPTINPVYQFHLEHLAVLLLHSMIPTSLSWLIPLLILSLSIMTHSCNDQKPSLHLVKKY